ncbi:hypothetical protein JL475_10340 [Streptomyces sp. M2CJ-2]|uniref:hypothetical protein n=1 Tax=Streptomyces sp. M2CJ-2 TaxID=2803948 RepID=UPI001921EA6A|nr:hypothetical protein [Streptomyces sp. M2CJ-2]MBL3666382.1 hypothetical protein [Streptomyces sp. M2CJ-2]
MFKSKKIAAVAGVLGGFALIGAGAVQAVGAEGPDNCVKDSQGTVRCSQVAKYEVTSEEYGKIRVVNDSTQTCSGGSGASCTNSVVIPGKKS